VVCQCLSAITINIAAAKTGVIKTSIRKESKIAILTKGNSTLRFLNPGIAKVLLVISKLVKDMVELTPAKITPNTSRSCEPTPLYLVLLENGVMNVQPAVTNVLFEHLVK